MEKLVPFFERLLSLLVVFLLLSGTVIWTGSYLGHTFTPPAPIDERLLPAAEDLAALGLSPSSLVPYDSASWNVVDRNGRPQGRVIATAPYAHDVVGFAGPTPLLIYIDSATVVKGLTSCENSETPDFYRRAEESLFAQTIGKTLADVAARKYDAVTGATYSSNAIIHNLKYTTARRWQARAEKAAGAPVIGWGRTIAVGLVLLLGLLAGWRWRGIKWVRLTVLLLNVGVTGFWCGQFLSFSLFRGWIANGVSPLLYLPTVLLLAVALVMPYLGRRHHYCQWVCPYGSLQELAWYLPFPKWPLSPGVYRVMRRVRYTVLFLLLMALWLGVGTAVLDYEPFTAFLVSTALPGVLVLAGAFVLLGIFIPRPWCHLLCPVGTLLDLAEDCGRRREKGGTASPSSSQATTQKG
jgi:hypothetical protein